MPLVSDEETVEYNTKFLTKGTEIHILNPDEKFSNIIMKIFIPAEKMNEQYPDYNHPIDNYVISQKNGDVCIIRDYINRKNNKVFKNKKEKFKRMTQWEWDFFFLHRMC